MSKSLISWSGGKDAFMSLQACQKKQPLTDIKLFSIFKQDDIAYHGVSKALIQAQAKALNLPLDCIETQAPFYLDTAAAYSYYEDQIKAYLDQNLASGFEDIYFGDIFLEDLKIYKENLYQRGDFKLNFPNWKMNTHHLIQEYIDQGHQAIIVSCIEELKDFCGSRIDANMIKQFPKHVDPCGENGEYHTYVYQSPLFNEEIRIEKGEIEFVKFPYSNLKSSGYYYQSIFLK